MIETLVSVEGITYQVIKDGQIRTYKDIGAAIRDEYQIGSAASDAVESVHYEIMENPSDLRFIGRMFRVCKPRFCNGDFVLWEYYTMEDGTAWLVSDLQYHVYAVFALRLQAMKYIHDKEER